MLSLLNIAVPSYFFFRVSYPFSSRHMFQRLPTIAESNNAAESLLEVKSLYLPLFTAVFSDLSCTTRTLFHFLSSYLLLMIYLFSAPHTGGLHESNGRCTECQVVGLVMVGNRVRYRMMI